MLIKFLKSNLIKNTGFYMLANVINAAVPFFMLPILTRYLTASDYGIVSILQVIQSFMVVFIGLNMHGAVSVNFFRIKKEVFKKFTGNVFIILLCSFTLVLIISVVMQSIISDLFNVPGKWIVIVAITAFFQYLITLKLVLWQVKKKPIPYGITQISLMILNIGFSLILVVALGMGWEGRIIGLSSATILFGIASLIILKKRGYLHIKYDKIYAEYNKYMLCRK